MLVGQTTGVIAEELDLGEIPAGTPHEFTFNCPENPNGMSAGCWCTAPKWRDGKIHVIYNPKNSMKGRNASYTITAHYSEGDKLFKFNAKLT